MIDPEKVIPMEFNVVVELLKTQEKVGNILLPEDVKDRSQRATTVARVVSIADRAFEDSDVFGPNDRPLVNDVVVVGKYAGQPLVQSPNDKDTNFRIVKDKDILGKLEASND